MKKYYKVTDSSDAVTHIAQEKDGGSVVVLDLKSKEWTRFETEGDAAKAMGETFIEITDDEFHGLLPK